MLSLSRSLVSALMYNFKTVKPINYQMVNKLIKQDAQLAELVDPPVSNTFGKSCWFESGAGSKPSRKKGLFLLYGSSPFFRNLSELAS